MALAVPAAKSIPPLVVLFSASACCPREAWPEAEAILVNELGTLGLSVAVVPAPRAPKDGPALSRLADAEGATCAIWVSCSVKSQTAAHPTQLEANAVVWVRDNRSAREATQQIHFNASGEDEPAKLLALRSTEAIRATLIQLRLPPEPGEQDAREFSLAQLMNDAASPPAEEDLRIFEPPVPLARQVATSPADEAGPAAHKRVGLGLNGGVLHAIGAPHPWGVLGFSLAYGLDYSRIVELEALVTAFGSEFNRGGHVATIDLIIIRANSSWQLLRAGRFRPSFGVALGVVAARSHGMGHDGLSPHKDRAVRCYTGGVANFDVILSDAIRMRVHGGIGWLVPALRTAFPGNQDIEFDLPLWEGGLGVVVTLF